MLKVLNNKLYLSKEEISAIIKFTYRYSMQCAKDFDAAMQMTLFIVFCTDQYTVYNCYLLIMGYLYLDR